MSDTRNARERLEALLTGLEDEVMRGEGCVDTDVTGMRAEMEALIGKHLGATGRAEAAASGAGDARGKVADAVERLGRWAGAGQSAMRAALGPALYLVKFGRNPPTASFAMHHHRRTPRRVGGIASSRYAAPPLRSGPAGDAIPPTRRRSAMAESKLPAMRCP